VGFGARQGLKHAGGGCVKCEKFVARWARCGMGDVWK